MFGNLFELHCSDQFGDTFIVEQLVLIAKGDELKREVAEGQGVHLSDHPQVGGRVVEGLSLAKLFERKTCRGHKIYI